MESDGHARSTCGVRELRDAPVRRSVRRWAAAARRPTSIVCWWRSGDAPAPTGHRAAACDQHDTRRHTATSMLLMLLLRPAAAPRGSATGSSKTALSRVKSPQKISRPVSDERSVVPPALRRLLCPSCREWEVASRPVPGCASAPSSVERMQPFPVQCCGGAHP